MLRNILRTRRWLIRRQINNCASAALRQNAYTKTLNSSHILAANRSFSVNPSDNTQPSDVDPAVFEQICNETLESLCEYFEELIDRDINLKGADVTYSDGVLTVALGKYGTYVINRQTPNKQIWLSSPTSGPKRYDLVLKEGGYWLYKHDEVTLHQLLQNEISKIIKDNVDFKLCSHSFV